MKKVICSQKAPGAIGPYSQAIEANGMIFVSGQLPIDAATYFDGDFPARSAVAVKALPKDALVEIECIAVR